MGLIDRQAAIDAFNTGLNELVVVGKENSKMVENYLNRVIDTIKKIASAQFATDTNVGTKLSTNLAEVGTDCISRAQAIEAVQNRHMMLSKEKTLLIDDLEKLPPAQPEVKKISYIDCANAMLMMWMNEVLTDGEYNRIMDKLNAHWAKGR